MKRRFSVINVNADIQVVATVIYDAKVKRMGNHTTVILQPCTTKGTLHWRSKVGENCFTFPASSLTAVQQLGTSSLSLKHCSMGVIWMCIAPVDQTLMSSPSRLGGTWFSHMFTAINLPPV